MAGRNPPDAKQLKRLLSKLKEQTPEYPAGVLAARRTNFLKQVSNFIVHGGGPKGEGGQQAGGSGPGPAIAGSTAAHGIMLQALIGFGFIAFMLIGSYFFRDQDTGQSDENSSITADGSNEPIYIPISSASTEPSMEAQPTEVPTTLFTPEIEANEVVSTPIVEDFINSITIDNDVPDPEKTNPGLHLGQTPGAPAAPGHGNPRNVNRPEKEEKDKPDKPDRPNR